MKLAAALVLLCLTLNQVATISISKEQITHSSFLQESQEVDEKDASSDDITDASDSNNEIELSHPHNISALFELLIEWDA